MTAWMPSVPPSAPLAPLPGMAPLRSGPVSREQEVEPLQAQAPSAANQLQAILARIGQVKEGGRRTALVAVVDPQSCVGCGACEEVCPAGAIAVHEIARIDRAKCTGCARCIAACPHRAIALKEGCFH